MHAHCFVLLGGEVPQAENCELDAYHSMPEHALVKATGQAMHLTSLKHDAVRGTGLIKVAIDQY